MDSTKTIPWSVAWHHCAGTFSYWAFIVGIIILGIVGGLVINRIGLKHNVDIATEQKVWWIAFFFAIGFAIMASPSSVAANTSIAMAAKGIFIY